ncbi:hypothetical protein GCM10009596_01570 [Arthrobacter rhombi]
MDRDNAWRGADEQYDRPGFAEDRAAAPYDQDARQSQADGYRQGDAGRPTAQGAESAGEPVGGHHADAYGGRVRQDGSTDPRQDGNVTRPGEAPPAAGDPLAMDSPDAYGEAAGQRAARTRGESGEVPNVDDVEPGGRHGEVPRHRDLG